MTENSKEPKQHVFINDKILKRQSRIYMWIIHILHKTFGPLPIVPFPFGTSVENILRTPQKINLSDCMIIIFFTKSYPVLNSVHLKAMAVT